MLAISSLISLICIISIKSTMGTMISKSIRYYRMCIMGIIRKISIIKIMGFGCF